MNIDVSKLVGSTGRAFERITGPSRPPHPHRHPCPNPRPFHFDVAHTPFRIAGGAQIENGQSPARLPGCQYASALDNPLRDQ